ncbi:MAG: hypothetical protein NZP34_14420, partial [Caldilineales bacterium]|nr:hypothetical protein [Caldilineales bacterium]
MNPTTPDGCTETDCWRGASTLALHAGVSRHNPYHSLTPPIVQTATYTFTDTADLIGFMEERMFMSKPLR